MGYDVSQIYQGALARRVDPPPGKAPDFVSPRLLQKAYEIGFQIGLQSKARRLAAAYYKKNMPAMLDRVQVEFAKTDAELKRLEAQSGFTYWGPDLQRQKKYAAVLERVSQEAWREAYRAVGA